MSSALSESLVDVQEADVRKHWAGRSALRKNAVKTAQARDNTGPVLVKADSQEALHNNFDRRRLKEVLDVNAEGPRRLAVLRGRMHMRKAGHKAVYVLWPLVAVLQPLGDPLLNDLQANPGSVDSTDAPPTLRNFKGPVIALRPCDERVRKPWIDAQHS